MSTGTGTGTAMTTGSGPLTSASAFGARGTHHTGSRDPVLAVWEMNAEQVRCVMNKKLMTCVMCTMIIKTIMTNMMIRMMAMTMMMMTALLRC